MKILNKIKLKKNKGKAMLQLTSLLNFDKLNQIERELDIKISYLALYIYTF